MKTAAPTARYLVLYTMKSDRTSSILEQLSDNGKRINDNNLGIV